MSQPGVEVAIGRGAITPADLCARVTSSLELLHAAGRDDEAWPHQRRAVEAFAEVGGIPADPDPGIWMLAAW
jgi:hypothetical protein